MGGDNWGKGRQGGRMGPGKGGDEPPQFGVFVLCTLHQRVFAGLREQRQDALLLDAEVRIELGGERLGDASRLCRKLVRRSRLGRMAGSTRQLQRAVMFAGKVLQLRVALHRDAFFVYQYFSKAICPGTPRRLVA